MDALPQTDLEARFKGYIGVSGTTYGCSTGFLGSGHTFPQQTWKLMRVAPGCSRAVVLVRPFADCTSAWGSVRLTGVLIK